MKDMNKVKETETNKRITVYSIMHNTAEISRDKNKIHRGCTLEQTWQNPKTVAYYSTKEEAMEQLQNYKSSVRIASGNTARYYVVEEYYVEESIVDDDHEFIDGGDIVEFADVELNDWAELLK